MNILYSVNFTLLLLTVTTTTVVARRDRLDCDNVKEVFQVTPAIAQTIFSSPQYDENLQLCKFSNHQESARVSCCSSQTEAAMLQAATSEFNNKVSTEILKMVPQLPDLRGEFEKMLLSSKRKAEYEIGSVLSLTHAFGREVVEALFNTLNRIILGSDHQASMFQAMDLLQDELFPYIIRAANSEVGQDEFEQDYFDCVKTNRRTITPAPFSARVDSLATSLHYSAKAAGFLQEPLDLLKNILNVTSSIQVSSHCYRDFVKLNHCQKCYGYTQLSPCRLFCEDVFVVCLNNLVDFDKKFGYHLEVMKILSKYIFEKVDTMLLLNGFAAEMNAAVNYAIMEYPKYKNSIEAVCGAARYKQTQHTRVKIWQKPPEDSSYSGDFPGQLRNLFILLDQQFTSFYDLLPLKICANEPEGAERCWDGLTERVNKKKQILEFQDKFAPYPEASTVLDGYEVQIRQIRQDVLTVFTNKKKQDSDGQVYEGSGSGQGSDDTEGGDDSGDAVTPTPSQTVKHVTLANEAHETIATIKNPSAESNNKPFSVAEPKPDPTIDYIEEKTTPKSAREVKEADSSSSSMQNNLTYLTMACILSAFTVILTY